MEVLSSTSVPLQAPTPLLPHSSRSSLLDRTHTTRKLAQSLDHFPETHSSSSAGVSASNSLPAQLSTLVHADPSTSLSPVTASATFRAPTRKSNNTASGFLPFVPLTPIMASPRLTPDPGAGSGTVVVAGQVDERLSQYVSKACSEVERENLGDVPVRKMLVADPEVYLNAGLISSGALSDIANHDVGLVAINPGLGAALVTPSWTSTPPTPPQRPVKSPRDSLDNESAPMRKRSSRNRLNQPRPASVAVFPEVRAVMDPPQFSNGAGWVPRYRYRTPSYAPEYQRFLERKTDYYLDEEGTRRIRRRQSLPPNYWKHRSPIPDFSSTSGFASPSFVRFPSESLEESPSRSLSRRSHQLLHPSSRPKLRNVPSGDLVLYPSLSRHPPNLRPRGASPLRATFTMREETRTSSSNGTVSQSTSGDITESQSSDSFKTAFEEFSTSFSVPDVEEEEGEDDDIQRPRGRKLFHLAEDGSDVEEGDRDVDTVDDHDTMEDFQRSSHSDGGTHDHHASSGSLSWSREDMKRYHVLMELLSTEVGYLMDLQALVTIYLHQLSSLSYPIPTPALSRPSPTSLSIASLSISRSFPSSRSFVQPSPSSSANLAPPTLDLGQVDRDATKEKDNTRNERPQQQHVEPARRPILSEKELGDIRRNAEDLVKFHERFVSSLKRAIEPLGYGPAFIRSPAIFSGLSFNGDLQRAVENVDDAVRLVAEAFTQQATSFQLYEVFCPGHNGAADLVRYVQENFSMEWESYEQRCSLLVAQDLELAVAPGKADESSDSGDSPEINRKQRRHSTPALSIPTQNLIADLAAVPTKSNPGKDRMRKASDAPHRRAQSQVGRLKFLDYLIKPVQRICKYPLLLSQLKRKWVAEGYVEDPVERACQAMKYVCTLVDEASMRQAHLVKSGLIVSRIMQSVPSAPISPTSGPQEERPLQLTHEFMSSLGVCLLAGGLDVVHHTSCVPAKYLGAFLYVGGYMVLVKVGKNGRVYEPKYWFSLDAFELIDAEEDDDFPFSFHLWCPGIHLQFAAACQQEKNIWVAAIADATSHAPSWVNEPVSSLAGDDKGQAMSEDDHHDRAIPLPTIQSLSELERNDDDLSPPSPMLSYRKQCKSLGKMDAAALWQDQPLSRRSSTASVKAFFTLDPYARTTRPNSQVRSQVDQGLGDVFSENCLAARAQAQRRDEDLFQVRKKTVSVMSRSPSGISIPGVPKRKRHESVVYGHRRKGSAEGSIMDLLRDPEPHAGPSNRRNTLTKKPKSIKCRVKQPLSLVPTAAPVPPLPDREVASPELGPESPSPLSQCSSVTSSNAGSILPSPLDPSVPLPIPSPEDQGTLRPTDVMAPPKESYRPKRTHSVVRSLFSRPASPDPSVSSNGHGSPGAGSSPVDAPVVNSGRAIPWYRMGSLRRRVQSSSDVPSDESNGTSPGQSTDDSHTSSVPPSMVQQRSSPLPASQSESRREFTSSPKRVAFMDNPPTLRRSFLGSVRLGKRPVSPDDSHLQPTPSRKAPGNWWQPWHRPHSLTPLNPIAQPSS